MVTPLLGQGVEYGMTKRSLPIDSNKFSAKRRYFCCFAKIGENLDRKLEVTKELVSRETAGMDAINDVYNVLMIEVFHSFIPTIGIDLNVTLEKKRELLRRRFPKN